MERIELTPTQAAYLAGLIDGEASLECQKEYQPKGKTPRFVLRLSFTLATPEPLATVASWLGCRVLVYPATSDTRSPRHRMHIYKAVALQVLEQVLPYLILKRRSAEIILAIDRVRHEHSPSRVHTGFAKLQPMPDIAIEQMEVLHQELCSLKSNKRPGGPRRSLL